MSPPLGLTRPLGSFCYLRFNKKLWYLFLHTFTVPLTLLDRMSGKVLGGRRSCDRLLSQCIDQHPMSTTIMLMLKIRGRKGRHTAKWHPRFNAADSDIIVESSDLTLFRLHRKNLQAYAGAFPLPPAAESTTTNENSSVAKIRLPEPVGVLEILFEYLYPKVRQPHPDLDDLDFKEFMSISDAVGKYQVFAAKHLCLIRLRALAKDHPLEIFHHAVEHGLPSAVDEAARSIVLYPVLGILKRLPADAFIPWLAYNEATRRAVFRVLKTILKNIKTTTPGLNSVCVLGRFQSVKDKCLNSAEVWVGYLENLSTFAELEAELQRLAEDNLFCDLSCGFRRCIEKSCQIGLQEAKAIKFTSFYFQE